MRTPRTRRPARTALAPAPQLLDERDAAASPRGDRPRVTPLDLQRRLARLHGRRPDPILLLVDEAWVVGAGGEPDAATARVSAEFDRIIRMGRRTDVAPPFRGDGRQVAGLAAVR